MFMFNRLTIGLFCMCSLAACDNNQAQVTKPKNTQEEIITNNLTDTNNTPSYEAAKYAIYGGWITDKSYIVISNGNEEKQLENIVKKNEKKQIINFKLAESKGEKLTAIATSKEGRNRKIFFTIELNKEQNQLTITMPNEKPVIYKKATMDPEEFNPEFVW